MPLTPQLFLPRKRCGQLNVEVSKYSMRSVFIAIIFSFISLQNYGQLWPISPMIRFGNTVYYKLEKGAEFRLHGTNLAFDEHVKNRYVDVLSMKDSIRIVIDSSTYYFKQKNRKAPKHNKEILLYSRRYLRSDYGKIKYMKLVEINDRSIIAKANIRHKKHLLARKETIEIYRSEFEGLFVGTGRNYRIFLTLAVTGGIVTVLIL